MGVNRQYAKEAFARYTIEYKADDSRALLKITHTYKVAQYCEEIAKNLPELDSGLIDLFDTANE